MRNLLTYDLSNLELTHSPVNILWLICKQVEARTKTKKSTFIIYWRLNLTNCVHRFYAVTTNITFEHFLRMNTRQAKKSETTVDEGGVTAVCAQAAETADTDGIVQKTLEAADIENIVKKAVHTELEVIRKDLEIIVRNAVAAADIKNIVKQAVKTELEVIQKDFGTQIQQLNDYVAALEARIVNLEDAKENEEQDQTGQSAVSGQQLQATLTAIKEENWATRRAANDNEQYGRRNNLRFRGLRLNKGQNCRTLLTEFINTKLQVQVREEDIEIAHPLPVRKQPTAQKHASNHQQQEPAIIARFRDRTVRDMVIRERRKLKHTSITIVEDLTSLNVEVMNRLRNSSEVDKSWSWNGHIFAVLKDKTKIRVRPFQSISECEVVE